MTGESQKSINEISSGVCTVGMTRKCISGHQKWANNAFLINQNYCGSLSRSVLNIFKTGPLPEKAEMLSGPDCEHEDSKTPSAERGSSYKTILEQDSARAILINLGGKNKYSLPHGWHWVRLGEGDS
jgi:hypothetical protein